MDYILILQWLGVILLYPITVFLLLTYPPFWTFFCFVFAYPFDYLVGNKLLKTNEFIEQSKRLDPETYGRAVELWDEIKGTPHEIRNFLFLLGAGEGA